MSQFWLYLKSIVLINAYFRMAMSAFIRQDRFYYVNKKTLATHFLRKSSFSHLSQKNKLWTTVFEKDMGMSAFDNLVNGMTKKNDTFIFTGCLLNTNLKKHDIFIGNINKNGEIQLIKTYSSNFGSGYAINIVITRDQNYVIGGRIEKDSGTYPTYIELSPNYDLKSAYILQSSTKNYGGVLYNIKTNDNNLLFVGYLNYGDSVAGFIIKISPDNIFLWSRVVELKDTKKSVFNYIMSTKDGAYLASGYLEDNYYTFSRALLVKFSLVGEVSWSITINVEKFRYITSTYECHDGSYIVSGCSDYDFPGKSYIAKISSSGNLLWIKALYGYLDNGAAAIIENNSGDYLLTGYVTFSDNPNWFTYTAKLNKSGDLIWMKVWFGHLSGLGQSIAEIGDGSYILIGSFDANALIARIDDEGNAIELENMCILNKTSHYSFQTMPINVSSVSLSFAYTSFFLVNYTNQLKTETITSNMLVEKRGNNSLKNCSIKISDDAWTVSPSRFPSLYPSSSPSSKRSLYRSEAPSSSPTNSDAKDNHSFVRMLIILVSVSTFILLCCLVGLYLRYKSTNNDSKKVIADNKNKLSKNETKMNVDNKKQPVHDELSSISFKMDQKEEENNGLIMTEPPLIGSSSDIHLENKSDDFQTLSSWKIPLDQLKIERRLVRGGFADVYRGEWGFQLVAIKIPKKKILPSLSQTENMRQMFEEARREARILSTLQHANIVCFKGIVDEVNQPFMIVMELGAGGSLYQRLYDSNNEMSRDLWIKIAYGISCGLDFLHCHNIVHCDLKSPNVILTGDNQAKLCDFDLSGLKEEMEPDPSARGTLLWMSPERTHTPQSDIWALGMLLFELVMHKTPFSDVADLMEKVKIENSECIPEACKKKEPRLTELMSLCWLEQSKRPTAKNIVESDIFESFHQNKR